MRAALYDDMRRAIDSDPGAFQRMFLQEWPDQLLPRHSPPTDFIPVHHAAKDRPSPNRVARTQAVPCRRGRKGQPVSIETGEPQTETFTIDRRSIQISTKEPTARVRANVRRQLERQVARDAREFFGG